MKSIKIRTKDGVLISAPNIYEDPTDFVNHIVNTNYFGKPERWVQALVEKEFAYDELTNPEGKWFPDERYEESDVIERETRTEPNGLIEPDGTQTLAEIEYVKLKADYSIEITDYIPPCPKSLTPRQARMTLSYFSIRNQVENAIKQAGQDEIDTWEYSNEIRRDWPLLKSMAISLGISDSQLDDMFRYGATL